MQLQQESMYRYLVQIGMGSKDFPEFSVALVSYGNRHCQFLFHIDRIAKNSNTKASIPNCHLYGCLN
jgi:hypothetical protein